MKLTRKTLLAFCFVATATSAMAAYGLVQYVNNSAGAGGYLLDDSAGFLLTGVGTNKLFAR